MISATFFLFIVHWINTAEFHVYNGTPDNIVTIQREPILNKEYKPVWKDLDTRPLPAWYDRAKVGIFLHWGVYSVPGFHSEWFWNAWNGDKSIQSFMQENFRPGFTYQEFAPMFTAEFFDPTSWAQLFKKAGAKYVVLTSKHHEGFTLFPSKRSFSWNSVEVGPHRDLVGDLSKTIREAGLEFGVYYSLYEWYNPMYREDKAANFTSYEYRDDKLWPELKQLVNDYKPSVIWSDGDWEAYDTYWNSTLFLAWLYNESPVKDHVVVNDRWGKDIPCKHGDFYNCQDRYHPHTLQPHKWENAFTVDSHSWGYRRNINISDILTIDKIINIIVSTVSCGGNVLINVGPTKEGSIAAIFQERLLQIGEWLNVNGEAIYESSPWLYQNDTINPDVWYTCKKTTYNAQRPTAVPDKTDKVTAIYGIFLNWPKDNVLKLGAITSEHFNHIELLGFTGEYNITWSSHGGVALINLPGEAVVSSKYAWTLKFTHTDISKYYY